jgi:tRNA nucleotidyltransferase (CCA-adding enzyme)
MENLRIEATRIHPLAIEVCRVLNEHNYQAFIVGGCVRDLILGQKPKDWDITSDASPEKIVELFPKTIPTGLQHGTVTVCMGEGVENHFEVTTFRIEGEYSDGRRPDEVFFVKNVEKDLARRDLTINAIAYDPIAHQLIDPYEGIRDINLGTIRAVGNAAARFQEDGLRIMRVARFAARFNYTLQSETFQGMVYSLETLKKVSKERISDELSKTLMSNHPSLGLQLLKDCGALDIACPLLAERQLPLLPRQDKCSGPLEVRLAFLYNRLPVKQVQQELMDLKFSNKEIKRVAFLLELVEQFHIFQENEAVSSYKNFIAVIKNNAPDPYDQTLQQFIQLMEAMEIEAWRLLDKYRHEVVFARKEMQLNGDDLLAAGMKAGVRIKITLDNCYLEILAHPEHNNKEQLLELARSLWIPI